MKKSIILKDALWIMVCAAVLLACSRAKQPANSGASPTGSLLPANTHSALDLDPPSPTPTGTPTHAAALGAPTPTAPPKPPSAGELEVRFTDPETQQECAGTLPFSIQWGEKPSIEGNKAYECAFEKQQCGDGVCILYHSSYALDFTLLGQILPPGNDYPSGSLHAAPALKFTMKQWWSDIPPETVMPFTEDNPFVVEGSDILELFFKFEEGARAEIPNPTMPDAPPMVFILHVKP